jgi:hypothetical protein
VVFREVGVHEVREVLRLWLAPHQPRERMRQRGLASYRAADNHESW